MQEDLSAQRAELRRCMLEQRGQLSAEQRLQMETALLQRLCGLPAVQEGKVFLVYCSYRSEVGTGTLIDQLLRLGKTVCVPLCDPDTVSMTAVRITDPHRDLLPGYKGIPEPEPQLAKTQNWPATNLNVVIVPGAVFDRRGYRLGYGGGYYDRFLALEAPQALRVGLGFELQLVDHLPNAAHDVPMDMLVTERQWLSWPRLASAVREGY